MKIIIKRIATYNDIRIEHGDVILNLGLYDEEESNKLSQEFAEAAEALSS